MEVVGASLLASKSGPKRLLLSVVMIKNKGTKVIRTSKAYASKINAAYAPIIRLKEGASPTRIKINHLFLGFCEKIKDNCYLCMPFAEKSKRKSL